MMAKEKMAPKREAPNVQPIFKPRYVFEAAKGGGVVFF
jgi:hypothetical protein